MVPSPPGQCPLSIGRTVFEASALVPCLKYRFKASTPTGKTSLEVQKQGNMPRLCFPYCCLRDEMRRRSQKANHDPANTRDPCAAVKATSGNGSRRRPKRPDKACERRIRGSYSLSIPDAHHVIMKQLLFMFYILQQRLKHISRICNADRC